MPSTSVATPPPLTPHTRSLREWLFYNSEHLSTKLAKMRAASRLALLYGSTPSDLVLELNVSPSTHTLTPISRRIFQQDGRHSEGGVGKLVRRQSFGGPVGRRSIFGKSNAVAPGDVRAPTQPTHSHLNQLKWRTLTLSVCAGEEWDGAVRGAAVTDAREAAKHRELDLQRGQLQRKEEDELGRFAAVLQASAISWFDIIQHHQSTHPLHMAGTHTSIAWTGMSSCVCRVDALSASIKEEDDEEDEDTLGSAFNLRRLSRSSSHGNPRASETSASSNSSARLLPKLFFPQLKSANTSSVHRVVPVNDATFQQSSADPSEEGSPDNPALAPTAAPVAPLPGARRDRRNFTT